MVELHANNNRLIRIIETEILRREDIDKAVIDGPFSIKELHDGSVRHMKTLPERKGVILQYGYVERGEKEDKYFLIIRDRETHSKTVQSCPMPRRRGGRAAYLDRVYRFEATVRRLVDMYSPEEIEVEAGTRS